MTDRGINALLVIDEGPTSPFDDMDMLGSLLVVGDIGGTRNTVSVYDLPEFCNSRFSLDRFEERFGDLPSRYANEEEIAKYLRNFGCLAVSVRGGVIIAGSKQIAKEYGRDDAKSRQTARDVLKAEAKIYMMWADGDIWGVVLVETDDEGGNIITAYDYPRYAIVLDSVWGYYGEDDAREAAKVMLRDQGQKPKSESGKSRNGGRRPAAKSAPRSNACKGKAPRKGTTPTKKTKGARR